jgi:hypothetical protein
MFSEPESNTNIKTLTNYKPRHTSEPIIQTSIINFHDKTIAVPDCLDNLDEHFGIFKIKIRSEIPIRKDLHVHLNVDKSGSMSERCSDGSSKMHHIQHTLENMLRIFHKKTESNISVHINSFDSDIYTTLDTIEDIKNKSTEELVDIIAQVYTITSDGSTNIEKTLISAATHLKKVSKDNLDKHIAHILLTDGHITDGKKNKTYLKSLVDNDYPNIFLGYGLDHDNTLLESLASTGKHNEYRLIDNLEKAGLVYGEVIHQLLYTALEDVTLKAENCEIYDYATNTWTNTLYIGHLISEQEKTFQIRTTNTKNTKKNPRESQIAIYGRTIHKTKPEEVLTDDIVLQTHVVPVIMDTIPCDLTNYMFRQKTQELLFETKQMHRDIQDDKDVTNYFTKYKNFLEKGENEIVFSELESQKRELKTKLKTKIKTFFNIMLDYVEANQMKDNAFYKMLCDDMYIAIKSFEIENGHMFAAARHTSQGRQQSYTPRFTEEELQQQQQYPDLQPTTLKRCNTLGPRQNQNQNPNPNPNPNLLTSMDEPNQIIRGYTLSQDDTSPYSSIGQVKMMREVSVNQNTTTNTEQTTSLLLDSP